MGCGASTFRLDSNGSVVQLPLGPEPTKPLLQKTIAMSDLGDVVTLDPHVVVQGTPMGHSAACVLGEPVQAPNELSIVFQEPQTHSWAIYGIFAYLPWKARLREAICLSKDVHHFLSSKDAHGEYWRWLCDCLCAESKLYLPAAQRDVAILARGSGDYKALFCDLWAFRRNFIGAASADAESIAVELPESIRLSTFCRLRPPAPASLDGDIAAEMLSTPVHLPLSQRVALLRQANPSLSHGAAMKMLLNKNCGAGEALPEEEASTPEERPKTSSTKPLVSEEAHVAVGASAVGTGFNASVLSVAPGTSGSVLTVSPGVGIRKWVFDHMFDEHSKQSQVYERCGLNLAVNFVNGQSASLIVFGQTGSGKTHTMFGSPGGGGDGVVTRVAAEVLTAVEARRAAGFEVNLGASYVEVFGNEVSNLLGAQIGQNRGHNQRMGHRYVLEGQCEEAVPNREVFEELLARGAERKRKAATAMNERSTRAHTLLIFRLRQQASSQEQVKESLLFLVDLGGSEKVSKSKANELVCAPGAINVGDAEISRVTWREYYAGRERITETNHINKGLLTLKRCVQALNERQLCAASGKELPRVPFHDSKLTLLLQPALSGQAATAVIICCNPEDRHAEETVQSLRFGEMCGSLEHKRAGADQDTKDAVAEAVQQIDAEIKEVEATIRQKEKWEWQATTRVDVVDEMDQGGTVVRHDEFMELGGAGAIEIHEDDGSSKKHEVKHQVWSQVLTGAEAENARRDELLKKRQKLLGGDAA
mmetsp:Transcript_35521/g.81347  ORF Transcript_35521/g.81347 Transcript_35521/m.81347 type:complete len:762 (+) Transcript_35521:60-2345(+)